MKNCKICGCDYGHTGLCPLEQPSASPTVKTLRMIVADLRRQLASAEDERDEELRLRLRVERQLDDERNARSALENTVCFENRWMAVAGGGHHLAVDPDRLGDLYRRLRRAEAALKGDADANT